MTRAHRIFIPGLVWHLTQRCHKREFLLKFHRDRVRWRQWLFQAVKRFDLCVLNYVATSNHIHLLVVDGGDGNIAKAMQLIAGRTAQEFNLRKRRSGAFWQDRYHATAIETNEHLARCLTYIDLNMVRAGVVEHPSQWPVSGFNEIQLPPQRCRIIDQETLAKLCGFDHIKRLRAAHLQWTESQLRSGVLARQAHWSEAIAVGSESFVNDVQGKLGVRFRNRSIERDGEYSALREGPGLYDPFSR